MNFNEIQRRWRGLRPWQKGAILGGGGHLVMAAVILIAYFIVTVTDKPGNGDMGPLSAWILLGLFWLLELIPYAIVYLIGLLKSFPFPVDPLGTSWTGWAWFALYLVYATAVYILLGIVLGNVVGFSKGVKKGANQ